ncbi:MAG: DUF1801 domain-containing protein [Clostridia bacterium]|jgi:hypothetical protein|nr:DUF1801 domain-containing protein [Clostridiaceae bacterium]HOA31459.1 DUF1801 domain-containing protein [Clostridia bacterium]
MGQSNLNKEVTYFLDSLNLSLRDEVECLREIIMGAGYELTESVKWNGPNYSINGEDRITIRISPKKQLQVIFHRGAKVKEMPKNRLLSGDYDILIWKENDRAIASFNTMNEIQEKRQMIIEVVGKWIEATT